MSEQALLAKDGGYIGVQYARFALIDRVTGKPIVDGIPGADENGIYKVSTKIDGGVTQAQLSGLAPSVTRIWGNNAVSDISIGKSQPSVAFTTNFLNHKVLAAILGRESDGKGGYDLEGKVVDLAMEIVSSTVAGGAVHFGFFDGYMTQGDLALQTNNENQSRVNDALTFSPIANDDEKIGKIYYDSETGFDQAALDQSIFGVVPKA
ncbi:phage tail protein [Secundilactobacillus kimchicus]|uniref:phage tail protein n=1 Tax=Secundilactobacillus kimchicus TaxID=528209 RepID=UPI0024A9FD21|nr:phage tail protein [Secundilactobacillus kimchicus]